MSTHVRSFSRAIMADIPDAVQQYVEQVAKHVADAIRSLWHTASAHPFEFVIAVATAGIFIFAWVLARSTKRLWDITQPMKIASTNQAKNRPSVDCPSRHSPLRRIGLLERPARSRSLHVTAFGRMVCSRCQSAGKKGRRRANGGSSRLAAHRAG